MHWSALAVTLAGCVAHCITFSAGRQLGLVHRREWALRSHAVPPLGSTLAWQLLCTVFAGPCEGGYGLCCRWPFTIDGIAHVHSLCHSPQHQIGKAWFLQGGTLRNYWRCLPRWSAHSLHVKTIVNTEHAKQAKG